jgi:hypothetical protein
MGLFYAGIFLEWWFGVFAGVFGESGGWAWCFRGLSVVDRVVKVVCGRTVFGGGFFAVFWDLFFGEFWARRGRHTPGAKAPFLLGVWRGPRLKPWVT